MSPEGRGGAGVRWDRVDAARLGLLELAARVSLKELLTATLDAAEALTGSTIGFFHFVDEDQTTLWLQAWSTNTVARMCTAEGADSHYPIDRAGVWADCVRQARPVVHNDYASLPGRKGMPEGHAVVLRELTVPVLRGGRVCAVLGVGNKPSDYDDADVADVASLADLAWDIAGRRRAEEELRASESRFRRLADGLPVGIFQASAAGETRFVNPAWRAVTGLGEGEGAAGPLGPVHGDDRDWVLRAWQGALDAARPFSAEYRVERPGGELRWVRAQASPGDDLAGSGYVGALVDVTEARVLQGQVAMSARMAALGTLVAGVAHEVNNPLAAVLADQGIALEIARDMRDRLRAPSPVDRAAEAASLDDVVEALAEAQEGGQRIARIVKGLTTFGRPDVRRERIRLGDLVVEAMRWVPATVGHAATVMVEDGGAPDVIASAGQIEQVVVNLVTNAALAIPSGRRGLVVVRLGPGTGGSARLDVVDDGRGIEPAILERIFEPFFTTRRGAGGGGTGLGLAICHSIVAAHGGTITVSSAPGRGSTFRVELPAADATA